MLAAILACSAIAGLGLWAMRREFAYFRATITLPWAAVGDYTRLTAPLGTLCTDLTGGWRMDVHAAMERRAQTLTGGASHAADVVAQPKPGYMARHAAIGDTTRFNAIISSAWPDGWQSKDVAELVHIGGRAT
jgi:hypothetical protein